MSSPLGMIAGSGNLPVRVAQSVIKQGREVYVIRIKGFEERELENYPGEVVGIGQVARQIKLLKSANCQDIVFAGIIRRPNFHDIKLDLGGIKILPEVLKVAKHGDDALMSLMIKVFEGEGFRVIGAEQASEGLEMDGGLIAGPEPEQEHLSDLKKAYRVASIIGSQDIGQGCVVCRGLVLAIEAQEGTDSMLERCSTLPEEIRGTNEQRSGVLVKCPKPSQDRRIDLPTIGKTTVIKAEQAGLAGIGVEKDGGLIIDREETLKLAHEKSVFIFGIDRNEFAEKD